MTQTRRNFLTASAAFCVAPMAVHPKVPKAVEKPSQQVDLESWIVEKYTQEYKKWMDEQFDSETGLLHPIDFGEEIPA